MAWTIPDKGEGDNDLQSIMFQEYLEILVAGINGVDCVLSGLAVTGGADMTPAVAKGAVLSNKTLFAVAAADVTITAADATNPRLDLIVVTNAGALAVRAGTPAANPKPPARSANDVVIAVVYVPATDTAIATTQIKDMRVMREHGPICIFKQTTARTINNSTAANSIFASALTLPSGLFLAGRALRVRAGGNFLINSGTPTIILVIAYGGSNMYADTSAVTAADADRRPWTLEFVITAQGNSDQAIIGDLTVSDLSTVITAPTTGIGDVWAVAGSNEPDRAFGGSAAVDSDAGNRVVEVTWQFNVANAADEFVCEYIIAELI